nr:DUF3604 domain-containing protein [Bacteroidales bacterium]
SSSLKARKEQEDYILKRVFLLGDLHNHCSISYGHGSLDDAITFASQQLDFFSVTGHFEWPDMHYDITMGIPSDVIEYHNRGFEKLKKEWPLYKEKMKLSQNVELIPFYSYEYHGFVTGDYTVVVKHLEGETTELPTIEKSWQYLISLLEQSDTTSTHLFIPHHIGYKTGYRGIAWDHYNEEKSPIVEIISMHGCAESLETPFPYLHTMGPLIGSNTMQGGIAKGHHFGVIGSTDHHNASPGSYMSGRTGVWAREKTRDAIWTALNEKATCALSGDPIEGILFASYNKNLIAIDAYIAGLDTIKSIEIIENEKVIHREFPIDYPIPSSDRIEGFLSFSFGWGEAGILCNWHITISLEDAEVISSSPRLRGNDIVDPLLVPKESMKIPTFKRDHNRVTMNFTTTGNSGNKGDKTQGCVVEIEGKESSFLHIKAEVTTKERPFTREYSYLLGDILTDSKAEYIDGFVSPVIYIKQFAPIHRTLSEIHISRERVEGNRYYLRAFQLNGDVLYTTPVWVNS